MTSSTPSRLAMLANSSGGGIGNFQPSPNLCTCSTVRFLSSGGNFSIRLPPSGSGAVSKYTRQEMRSGIRSAAPAPHPEQSFVDGKKRPTLTLRLKLHVALYSTWRTNSPKAASRTERDSLVFASPFVFKSSTQTQSYSRVRSVVRLWRRSFL